MTAFADDYLAAQPLIIAVLEAAKIPTVKAVLPARSLAGVTENKQITPAIHVLFGGESMPTSTDMRGVNAKPQVGYQTWWVVIAVNNVQNIREGQGARDEAGPMLRLAINALQGATLSTDFPRPLRRATAPAPKYNSGFAYFPLAFLLEVDT